MGRATYFPPHRYKKSVAARIIPRSITSPKLSENCAGLTAIATVGKRQLTTVSCGSTPASAQNYVVFRAPSSGATIIYAGISPGSDQSHAAAETDTWIFDIVNRTSGNSLSQNTPSLSGQTLAATAYKELPVGGKCIRQSRRAESSNGSYRVGTLFERLGTRAGAGGGCLAVGCRRRTLGDKTMLLGTIPLDDTRQLVLATPPPPPHGLQIRIEEHDGDRWVARNRWTVWVPVKHQDRFKRLVTSW